MTTTTRLLTAEEYAELPDDHMRTELVRGELVHMVLPGGEHGDVAAQLLMLVGGYVKSKRLGKVYAAETGYLMGRDPDTVRGADMTFIRRERLAQIADPRKQIPIPPDLAVEVISPNDRRGKIDAKTAEWLAFGVRLLWNVNPRNRTVTVRRPGAAAVILGADDTLDGGDVVPGFQCRVAELFE